MHREDIVLISSIDWRFVWQGHQEIASRLARRGHRVAYVENTGVRAPQLRDARRVVERLGNWARRRDEPVVRDVEGVSIVSPLVLPPNRPVLGRINRSALVPAIARRIKRLGFVSPQIWTFLPTDTAVDLIRRLDTGSNLVVYYCIADFAELADRPQTMQENELRLLERADVVFAQEPALAAKCRAANANVHVFPFGVNLDAFPYPARDASVEAPRDGAATFTVGYVGGLHREFDFDLIRRAAQRRPMWDWVLVGPKQTADVATVESLPNVHMLGQVPHDRLAEHIAGFDVCIVPYVRSAYTETVVPTKINEYLALGKPVVATDLPPVIEFNRQHGVLEVTPNEPTAFVDAIQRAASGLDEGMARRRRQVAELADWGTRLSQMLTIVADAGRQTPTDGSTASAGPGKDA